MLKLAEIEAEEITFPAEDRPGWYPNKQPVPLSHLPRLLERVAAPDKVTVKVCIHALYKHSDRAGQLIVFTGRSAGDVTKSNSSLYTCTQ